jgi:hypothetical protein
MLKLFRNQPSESTPTGPSPGEMRGRAAQISDAGTLPWEVLWEALKTEPPAGDAATLTRELGLDEETEIRAGYERSLPGTQFAGTRRGRRVGLRIGVVPSVLGKAVTEAEVAAAVAPFRIRAAGGRLVAEPGAMSEVGELLGELGTSSKVWRDVVVDGGPEVIRARRPITMQGHPQGYVYDLWLVERLADRLGA